MSLPPDSKKKPARARPDRAGASRLRKPAESYHHGALHEAVLLCARERLARGPYGDFTVSEVARELGVTHAAVFKHFPSKRSIIAALAERAIGAFTNFVATWKAPPDMQWGAHAVLAEAYVAFAQHEPGLFRALFHHELSALSEFPALAAMRRTQFEVLAAYFGSIAPGSSAREVEELALAHWALVHGLAILLRDGQIPSSLLESRRPDELAGALARLLEVGIRPKPGGARKTKG